MLNHFLVDIVPQNYLLVDGGVKRVDFEYSSFGCSISPISLSGSIKGKFEMCRREEYVFLDEYTHH